VSRLDADDVRDAAAGNVESIIVHSGIKFARSGSHYRLASCVRCGADSGSKSIAVNARTGSWCHHGRERENGGECSGDVLDLFAAIEGLDCRREFGEVLERAAKFLGVDAREYTDAEQAERKRQREHDAAARAQAAERERASMIREAMLTSAATWQRVGRQRRNRAGEAYLRHRGLDPEPMVMGGLCRFDLPGNVHVPLWSLDESELINVVHRVISETNTGPKVLGLTGCPTSGTLCGRVRDITPGCTVMVTEGVIDTLTAIQLWPDRVVLGAHGASRLLSIVETVAPILASKGGRLVLVPDGDEVGQRNAIRAGEAALDAGLVMDESLFVMEIDGHKDLNEAHGAGWKP